MKGLKQSQDTAPGFKQRILLDSSNSGKWMKMIKSGHVLMGENRTKNVSQQAETEDSYPCGFGRFMVKAVRRRLLSR